ncbi:MAG: stage 0 sporulation family protein [Oscillospiraceae bacterium]|nr:stage 0 sporulation family protein [Oscillospiraceae bacterium]
MEDEILIPSEQPEVSELPAQVQVVDIQFRPGQKIYFFDPAGIDCKAGDHVIIDTARGPEFGTCVAGIHTISSKEVVAPLRPVLRIATAHDEKVAAENHAKEKKAYEVCLQKIAEHNLDMQLVSAECAFDGSKILFFFTADERVDFRELVKNLASVFHTRIELRQIGVRDKAKMVGGLGICGRPFCCASFLDDFQPVSIKMAKTQNLSLNPTKISGTCGRLMCCLKYEQDAYEDLLRTSPKAESFVDTPEGRGTVVEVDLLRQRVKVRMEEHPEEIHVFPNAEIAVLRNGKAKKNDPPIPADLAPISKNGKRVKKVAEESDEPVFLDPIRFRYSTEAIVEEPEVQEEEETEEQETEARRSSNRRRKRRPKTDAPKEAQPAKEAAPKEPQKAKEPAPKEPKPAPKQEKKAPKQENAPAEKQEAAPNGEGEAKKPHHRRRPNYRRRPNKPKQNPEG